MGEDGWVRFQCWILLLVSLAALTQALTEEQVFPVGHFYIETFYIDILWQPQQLQMIILKLNARLPTCHAIT